jgi:ribosome-binding protein aMBF1 (putative translation factor)
MSERRHRPVFPGFKEMAERADASGGADADWEARRALAAALSAKRAEVGLSQTEVAALMGTSQSAVARLESGDADLRLSTLERYAAALGQRLDIRLSVRPPEA